MMRPKVFSKCNSLQQDKQCKELIMCSDSSIFPAQSVSGISRPPGSGTIFGFLSTLHNAQYCGGCWGKTRISKTQTADLPLKSMINIVQQPWVNNSQHLVVLKCWKSQGRKMRHELMQLDDVKVKPKSLNWAWDGYLIIHEGQRVRTRELWVKRRRKNQKQNVAA